MSPCNRIAVVTGAAGFLGSHTTERLLERGYEVRAIDIPGAPFDANLRTVLQSPHLTLDCRNILDIKATDSVFAGASVIFHCAGIADHRLSTTDPELYMSANFLAVVRILEAARHRKNIRVIYPSSAAVYGTAVPPTREDHPINPGNPYGLSKWLGEEACHHWHKVFGVPTLSFRIFNCYGPRGLTGGPVVFFAQKRLKGEPLTLTGDGSAQRDFIYVADVIDAFIAGAESDRAGESYNLGTGIPETVRRLAELVGGEIVCIPARPEPPVILADISKIRRELGWAPRVTLAEGIKRVLDDMGLSSLRR